MRFFNYLFSALLLTLVAWVFSSLTTSAMKVVNNECHVQYVTEVFASGNWFCTTDPTIGNATSTISTSDPVLSDPFDDEALESETSPPSSLPIESDSQSPDTSSQHESVLAPERYDRSIGN